MNDETNTLGKTTIAPEVLVKIATLTTLSIPGVNRLAANPSSVDRLLSRSVDEGVRIVIENDTVYVDLYVILNHDANLRDVCRTIQKKVSRAVSEMVGMEIGRVNIHVEDIEHTVLENPQTE